MDGASFYFVQEVIKIPYQNNSDLPARVREAMPEKAQSVFRNTFNSVIDQEGATEATAFAQAYGAVDNAGYHQDSEGDWVKKQIADFFTAFINKHANHNQKTHGNRYGSKGGAGSKGGKTTAGSSGGGSSGGGSGETKKELNDADKKALLDYTGRSATSINRGLRSGKDSKQFKTADAKAKAIDKALEKLPPVKKDSSRTMFLNEKTAKQFLNTHKEGSPVAYTSFTSTSTGRVLGTGLGGDIKVNMTIKGKNGRDISSLSKYPTEKEILFPRNSKFVVTKVNRSGNNVSVELKEVA